MNMSEADGSDRKPAVLYQTQTVVYPQADKKPEVFRQQQWNQVSQKVIEQMHGEWKFHRKSSYFYPSSSQT